MALPLRSKPVPKYGVSGDDWQLAERWRRKDQAAYEAYWRDRYSPGPILAVPSIDWSQLKGR